MTITGTSDPCSLATPADVPVRGLLAGWRFPAAVLALLAGQELVLLAMLVWPMPATGGVAFVEEFKIWCFGFDPATGAIEWASVITTLTAPLVLGAVALGVWSDVLFLAVRSERGRLARWSAGFAAAGMGLVLGVTGLAGGTPAGELPFPADALRIAVPLHPFALVDHTGAPISSEDLAGRVVLLTAVYSSCGFT